MFRHTNNNRQIQERKKNSTNENDNQEPNGKCKGKTGMLSKRDEWQQYDFSFPISLLPSYREYSDPTWSSYSLYSVWEDFSGLML